MQLTARQLGRLLHSAAFASLVGVYLGAVLQFILRLYVARQLGPVSFGDVALALVVINLVAHLAMVGFNHGLPRLVGQYRAQADASRILGAVRFALMITCAAAAAAAVVGVAVVLGLGHERPERLTTLVLALAVVPLLAVFHLLIHAARSFQRMWLARLPYNVVLPTLVIAVVLGADAAGRLSAPWVIGAYGLLSLPLLLDVARRLRREPALKHARDTGHATYEPRAWLALGLPNLAFTGCNQMLRRMDVLFVALLASDEALGVYALAFNFALVVTLAVQAANAYVSSSLAEAYTRGDNQRLRREARATARLALGLCAGLALLLALVGQPVFAYFGPGFEPGYMLLMILLVGILGEAWFAPGVNLLQMADRERLAAKLLAVLMLLSAVGYIVLLPLYGVMAAAGVAAGARLTLAYLAHRACRRQLNCSAAAL